MKEIVKSVIPKGTYESQYGTMYKYEISIGEHTGEYSSKKYQTKDAEGFPFVIDSEVEYEYTPHEKYPKIKPAQSGNYNGGHKKNNGGNASFSMSYAKDVLVASYMTSKDEIKPITTDQMFALADKMTKWLNDNQ